jgi:flagellar L-ring protein precursor FlgH
MDRSRAGWLACVGIALCAGLVPAAAAADQPEVVPPKQSTSYDELYARYLDSARQMPQTGGSQAVASFTWMANLGFDPRARNLNDLVTVRVVESIVATGSADTALSKNGSGHASVSNLFGLENHLPDWIDPTNLVNTENDTKFKGGGTTTRSGELVATMTARVVEVLPNGDLVLEGAREIDINGDRQVVVLTGVVRPADVGPRNVVQSTSIGQLRILYFGRGLIKDNLKPGWLIRVLNKVF